MQRSENMNNMNCNNNLAHFFHEIWLIFSMKLDYFDDLFGSEINVYFMSKDFVDVRKNNS